MNEDTEVWRPIKGYPGYIISSHSNLKRLAYVDARGRNRSEHYVTKTFRDECNFIVGTKNVKIHGYFRLIVDNRPVNVSACELVCKAFFADYSRDFYEIRFHNNKPDDCHLKNLILVPRFIADLEQKLKNNNERRATL